jgi:hypothetical protein
MEPWCGRWVGDWDIVGLVALYIFSISIQKLCKKEQEKVSDITNGAHMPQNSLTPSFLKDMGIAKYGPS